MTDPYENNIEGIAVDAILESGFERVPAGDVPRWPLTSGRYWFVRDNDTTRDCVGLDYNFGGGLSAYLAHRLWIPETLRLWDVAPQEMQMIFRANLTERILHFTHEYNNSDTREQTFELFASRFSDAIQEWYRDPKCRTNEAWIAMGIRPSIASLEEVKADTRRRWLVRQSSVSIQWQEYFANEPTT